MSCCCEVVVKLNLRPLQLRQTVLQVLPSNACESQTLHASNIHANFNSTHTAWATRLTHGLMISTPADMPPMQIQLPPPRCPATIGAAALAAAADADAAWPGCFPAAPLAASVGLAVRGRPAAQACGRQW